MREFIFCLRNFSVAIKIQKKVNIAEGVNIPEGVELVANYNSYSREK